MLNRHAKALRRKHLVIYYAYSNNINEFESNISDVQNSVNDFLN